MSDSIELTVKPLRWVAKPTPELSKSLLDASTRHLGGEERVLYLDVLIHYIEQLVSQTVVALIQFLNVSCYSTGNTIRLNSRPCYRVGFVLHI